MTSNRVLPTRGRTPVVMSRVSTSLRLSSLRLLRRLQRYRFQDRWLVPGDVRAVASAMQSPKEIMRWWPCFRQVDVECAGGRDGLGSEFTARIKGIMPYVLQLAFRVDEVHFPHGFHADVSGDLVGRGGGRLTQVGDDVQIDFELDVRIVRPSLRVLYALAHPLGYVQHGGVMRKGEQGLRQSLASGRPWLAEAA